jgi:hypothetical protein
LTIDDPRVDPINPSCFSNQSGINFIISFHYFWYLFLKKGNGMAWQYNGSTITPKSSLTILPSSLSSNQTYQFMVIMTHRQTPSVQATGYLLIRVVDSNPQLITLA